MPRFTPSPLHPFTPSIAERAPRILQEYIAKAGPSDRDILDGEAVAAGLCDYLGEPAAAAVHADLDDMLHGARPNAVDERQPAQALDQVGRVALAGDAD